MTIWISPSQPGDWWTDDEVADGYAPHDIRPMTEDDPENDYLPEVEEQWSRLRAGEQIRRAFDRE